MPEYEARIARWVGRFDLDKLSPEQAEGFACVSCGTRGVTFVVVGAGTPGVSSHVFACRACDQIG